MATVPDCLSGEEQPTVCVDLTLRVTVASDATQSPVLITARAGGAGTPLIAGGKLADVQALVFQAVEEALARAQAAPASGPPDGDREAETPEDGEEPVGEAESPAPTVAPPTSLVAPSPAGEGGGPQLTLLAFDF